MAYGGDISFTTHGIDDVVRMFEKLASPAECEEMYVNTVKAGANVVADIMRAKIEALKTTKSSTKGDKRYRKDKRYCTENEKKGLLASMGWSPVSDRYGEYNSNIGFDGYNQFINSKYDHANAVIANTINRGASFQICQPFISSTRRAGINSATEKMREKFEEEIAKRTH